MKELDMTWREFEELRLLCDAINHAKTMGVQEGDVKNTIVTSTWTTSKVEIKINIE